MSLKSSDALVHQRINFSSDAHCEKTGSGCELQDCCVNLRGAVNQDVCATFPWFDGEYDPILSFALMCFCPSDPPVSDMFFGAQIMYLNPPQRISGALLPW